MINVSGPLQLINSRSSSINWHRVRRQDRVERAGNSGANLPEHGGVRPEAQPRPQSSGGGTCAWFAAQISVGESQPTAYVVAADEENWIAKETVRCVKSMRSQADGA